VGREREREREREKKVGSIIAIEAPRRKEKGFALVHVTLRALKCMQHIWLIYYREERNLLASVDHTRASEP